MPILSQACSGHLELEPKPESVQPKTKVVIFGFRWIEMQSNFHFARKTANLMTSLTFVPVKVEYKIVKS